MDELPAALNEDRDVPDVSDPWNRMDERSLINLLTPALQAAAIQAQQARPELFGLSEKDLDKALRWEDKNPCGTDNALRMRFWQEYGEAQATGRKMRVHVIPAGICNPDYFFSKVMKKPEKMAWILNQPASYETSTEEMHLFALAKMRKMLEEEVAPHGKFNAKVAEAQIKIFQILDTRVRGAVVQKTLNVHSTVPAKGSAQRGQSLIEKKQEIEQRLAELERLSQESDASRGQVVDAIPVGAKQV